MLHVQSETHAISQWCYQWVLSQFSTILTNQIRHPTDDFRQCGVIVWRNIKIDWLTNVRSLDTEVDAGDLAQIDFVDLLGV
jgi:hypothetical protein